MKKWIFILILILIIFPSVFSIILFDDFNKLFDENNLFTGNAISSSSSQVSSGNILNLFADRFKPKKCTPHVACQGNTAGKIDEKCKFTLTKNCGILNKCIEGKCVKCLKGRCNPQKKFLTLVVVSEAGGQEYNSSNYVRVLKNRENDDVQIFDVIIWDNGNINNPKIISIYKFNRTFDPFQPPYIEGGQAWVQYRESFNILNINISLHNIPSCKTAQGIDYYKCSNTYLEVFKSIFRNIVTNQPAQHYGLKYLGHGTSSGLFENVLSKNDSHILLSYTNLIIGKKLDFLDWSYNCDMGSYQVISDQYNYADYIISSDLLRGGFNIDWVNDYYRLKPEGILIDFFSPLKTIKQSLIGMVNSERALWETPTTRNDMTSKQIKQSVSIYDSSKFKDLIVAINLESMPPGDVLNYIKTNYPSQEQKFYNFRFYYVNNKDFFNWNADSNGFKYL